jgi:hypothetical protein
MKEEEILDKPFDKKTGIRPINWIFYLASLFLILRFLFYYQNWPYSDYFFVAAAICYEVFSLLRLIYYPDKTLFQYYSYIFFILVIPGFIMDYMHWAGADIFLYAAAFVPVLFFSHLLISRMTRKKE